MLGVIIASIVGIAIMAVIKVELDAEWKIKMPRSFWAYVAWCVLMNILAIIF